MTTLHEHLIALDPSESVRLFATELAQRTAIESHRAHDYVGLSPSMDGVVAVHAHRRQVSIALSPEQAAEAAHRFPGAKQEKGDATTYLHLRDGLLSQYLEAAVELAVKAVARAVQSTSTRGGHARTVERDFGKCPKHGYPLTASGSCWGCE